MKEYLIQTFQFNNFANTKLIEKVGQLPDKTECMKLISHLINCMYKWLARANEDPNSHAMSWWDPLYQYEDLQSKWNDSLEKWISFLEKKSDSELKKYVRFIGFDGGNYEARYEDIALQLNYHSIHHRAQMQTIIRQQGLEPDFLDYIGTVYRKID
jgi:uncharacterized damage-inducible protein DinB